MDGNYFDLHTHGDHKLQVAKLVHISVSVSSDITRGAVQ